MAFTAITTRTPSFLIIAFDTFRNIVMNYKSNIGLIDTHSKGYGSDHDIDIFH